MVNWLLQKAPLFWDPNPVQLLTPPTVWAPIKAIDYLALNPYWAKRAWEFVLERAEGEWEFPKKLI